jgi:hypothetical protein
MGGKMSGRQTDQAHTFSVVGEKFVTRWKKSAKRVFRRGHSKTSYWTTHTPKAYLR